jgi:hypothetical protein
MSEPQHDWSKAAAMAIPKRGIFRVPAGQLRPGIPHRPLRRQLRGMPRFVVTRGGEYCFLPSHSALCWLSDPANYL